MHQQQQHNGFQQHILQQQQHPMTAPLSNPSQPFSTTSHNTHNAPPFSNENLPPQQPTSTAYGRQNNINSQANIKHTNELHQSFLMMNGAYPHTPPHHLNQPNSTTMRCQSVPATSNPAPSNAGFQPLTPQLNRMSNTNNNIGGSPINAKRNLSFVFDSLPGGVNNNNNSNGHSFPGALNHDRLVPTSSEHHHTQGNLHHQQQSNPKSNNATNQHLLRQRHDLQPNYQQDDTGNLYDLAFPLNDISSPDDLSDIHLDKIDGGDGDDLIKSLHSNPPRDHQNLNNNNSIGDANSSWVDDWSNATLPVMNIS